MPVCSRMEILRERGDGGRDVGRADVVLGTGEVLDLVVDDVGGSLQPVDAGAQRAAQSGDSLNRRIDGGESSLRRRSGGESCSSHAAGKRERRC